MLLYDFIGDQTAHTPCASFLSWDKDRTDAAGWPVTRFKLVHVDKPLIQTKDAASDAIKHMLASSNHDVKINNSHDLQVAMQQLALSTRRGGGNFLIMGEKFEENFPQPAPSHIKTCVDTKVLDENAALLLYVGPTAYDTPFAVLKNGLYVHPDFERYYVKLSL